MTPSLLHKELVYVNHSLENRNHFTNIVLNNPNLIPKIMEIMFDVEDKVSYRAAWLFEFIARKNINAVLPYIDDFTSKMNTVTKDSAVRPIAKVCEYLVEAYYHNSNIRVDLSHDMKVRIIEVCFDYLITSQKVAPQVYAMNALYLLGKEYSWIHPELIAIINRNFSNGSKGYQAKSRHILKKLKV